MKKKLQVAVMQPYIFPYIGQLSLIDAVDHCVFFDDVSFMKKQFTHKNTIIVNHRNYTFTIPLKKKSQNQLIKNIQILDLETFKNKFFIILYHGYKKSKYFTQGMDYVDKVLSFQTNLICDLAIRSIEEFFKILDIKKSFHRSSILSPETQGLQPASDRLISITKKLDSACYINGPGGVKLYSKSYFLKQGVKLDFLDPNVDKKDELSIIHLLMNYSKEDIEKKLKNYNLF